MNRIDGHLHVWQGSHPDRPYPWTPDPFPAEDLLPILDANGIDIAVHVSPVIVGWDNSYGNTVTEAFPDRFRVFGRFDPLQDDIAGALDVWMASPGASGVRLTAYRAGESGPLDDDQMQPFWEAATTADVPVAVFAPGRLTELANVARSFPGLRMVLDHLGLGVFRGAVDPFAGIDDLTQFAPLPRVLVKVSALPEVAEQPFPFPDVHRYLRFAVDTFGADRLIWGSNWPVESIACTYEEACSWISASGVVEASDVDLIMGGTMAGLLRIESETQTRTER